MELLAACQAIDLRRDQEERKLGKGSEGAYRLARSKVGTLEVDRVMYPDIQIAKELVSSGKLVKTVRRKLNPKE